MFTVLKGVWWGCGRAGAASVDVAVFCLALMGTDYPAFLREAHRVLRAGGRLWVAEVGPAQHNFQRAETLSMFWMIACGNSP